MDFILHIIESKVWEMTQHSRTYCPPSLETEGFIHFSTPSQVAASANRHYYQRRSLLLLVIDPQKLTAELKYEPPAGSADRAHERYPHLYGALNLDAVVRVIPFLPGADGQFSAPDLS
jgi:uncharacterized protein (DUF952 family)